MAKDIYFHYDCLTWPINLIQLITALLYICKIVCKEFLARVYYGFVRACRKEHSALLITFSRLMNIMVKSKAPSWGLICLFIMHNNSACSPQGTVLWPTVLFIRNRSVRRPHGAVLGLTLFIMHNRSVIYLNHMLQVVISFFY